MQIQRAVIGSSAAEVKKNLSAVVGGSITLPDPLMEFGFLLVGGTNAAFVNEKKLKVFKETYMNRIHWSRNSGLFTITDLQKNDSGIYIVDSKEGRGFSAFYNLTVYDPAPPPAVQIQPLSSELCWLICSVEHQATLLWIRDQDILNQSSSALSVTITVHEEDRNSAYSCVAANPAENHTVDVNVKQSCGFNSTENGDNHNYYLIVPLAVIAMLIVVVPVAGLVIWIKRRNPEEKETTRPTGDSVTDGLYAEVQVDQPQVGSVAASPEFSDRSDRTVYTKLKLPAETPAEPVGSI